MGSLLADPWDLLPACPYREPVYKATSGLHCSMIKGTDLEIFLDFNFDFFHAQRALFWKIISCNMRNADIYETDNLKYITLIAYLHTSINYVGSSITLV